MWGGGGVLFVIECGVGGGDGVLFEGWYRWAANLTLTSSCNIEGPPTSRHASFLLFICSSLVTPNRCGGNAGQRREKNHPEIYFVFRK